MLQIKKNMLQNKILFERFLQMNVNFFVHIFKQFNKE
jgi:hypothetical protein